MSKTILVKEESFYTFLEKNVLGYQKKEDNSRVCAPTPIIQHEIFISEKTNFIFLGNGIEINDRIVFEFSEYNYFLKKRINYTATFDVIQYDSVLLELSLFDKAIKN